MIDQAIRYGLVGLLSVGLYISFTWILLARFGIDRNWAIFIAFAVATTFNYLANFYWSFTADTAHRGTIIRYAILVAIGLMWNELGVELLHLGRVPLLASVIICAAAWSLVSFATLRGWVFRTAAGHPEAHE